MNFSCELHPCKDGSIYSILPPLSVSYQFPCSGIVRFQGFHTRCHDIHQLPNYTFAGTEHNNHSILPIWSLAYLVLFTVAPALMVTVPHFPPLPPLPPIPILSQSVPLAAAVTTVFSPDIVIFPHSELYSPLPPEPIPAPDSLPPVAVIVPHVMMISPHLH